MSVATLAALVALACLPLLHALTMCAVKLLGPFGSNDSATSRADALLVRTLAPAAISLLLTCIVILPAFLIFEPPHGNEHGGWLLLTLAALGTVQLAVVTVRGLRIVWLSRVLTRQWTRGARALGSIDGLPAFAVDASFPVVAVGGIVRPRLFVDRRVLDVCSPHELDAIAAHEQAHVRRRDNLRRLLLGACAGPSSRAAFSWRQAAEHAADEEAASSARRAVDLASALLKIARLAPPSGVLDATAFSTIHDGGSLELRVRNLLAFSPATSASHARHMGGLLLVIAVPIVMYGTPLLRLVHAFEETLVRSFR